ncbi:dihydroxyacetone kinase subunit DhaL [Alteribacillus sp. HJP-4]|uniref:dihydroxyacetone kinase subunit DhaL n=1 Tax=Alteribacillus sp. HJP-4 TaxID=2775394 RepID=UPI0035CD1EBA
MNLNISALKKWLYAVNSEMQQNKDYLSELDQSIGDGDHGYNVARGFHEAAAKIENADYEDAGSLLKDTAMTLISKVGGASGPLYGTAFLKAADTLKDVTSLTEEHLAEALQAAINGLKQRGKAEIGDKTMLDVWVPVCEYIRAGSVNADQLKSTAREAAESTKPMTAKKGRASYLQERSVDHMDPGAYSSYLLFKAMADILHKEGAQ